MKRWLAASRFLAVSKCGRQFRIPGFLVASVMLVLCCAGCGKSAPEDPIVAARDALDFGRYEEADSIASGIAESDPKWPQAQYIRGAAASGQNNHRMALFYWKSIPRDGSEESLLAAMSAAHLQFLNCRFQGGVKEIEYCLQHKPGDIVMNRQMVALLNSCGLSEQAEPYLIRLLQAGQLQIPNLVALVNPDREYGGRDPLSVCEAGSPDPYQMLHSARQDIRDNRVGSAVHSLKQVSQKLPDVFEAHAMLGTIYLSQSDADFLEWHQDLPPGADRSCRIWFVRGMWARGHGFPEVAAGCFHKAAEICPADRRSLFQLGQVLTELEKEEAKEILQRAADLQKSFDLMEQLLLSSGRNESLFEQLVHELKHTGRHLEAKAWAHMAMERHGPKGWILETQKELASTTGPDSPRYQPAAMVTSFLKVDGAENFETALASVGPSATKPDTGEFQNSAIPLFVDSASELGIAFEYFQGPNKDSRGVRIFESTGGGVTILDADRDGRQDLFLTQGEKWLPGYNTPTGSADYADALFRNRSDHFEQISEPAGIAPEDGYGQGCSAGDFNNDGFPDLYVANIGSNCLLQNNGDGTFTRIDVPALAEHSKWTTSCLILDLNNDGSPDLYDVNYLTGKDIFAIECGHHRCSVNSYEGEPDDVLLSDGGQDFDAVANATPASLAKGLGIVAWYPDGQEQPLLFIANDQVPNFLLTPTEQDGIFQDEAPARGLAVNMDGKPTAAMGVAAGDINHDRRVDLFVTNFEAEANCLYLQNESGFFHDGIMTTGLRDAGMAYVGWGTQFIDIYNRGAFDIVVTNGHIADFGESGRTYEMPLQLFQQTVGGRYQEAPPSAGGAIFEQTGFWRSLAVWDWNEDGRMDFVASGIATQTAVGTCQAPQSGHWLKVQLNATRSARDAFGATVEVQMKDSSAWQQLLAGSGYQATNEKTLHFGLGETSEIDEVIIQWPSGATSRIQKPSVD